MNNESVFDAAPSTGVPLTSGKNKPAVDKKLIIIISSIVGALIIGAVIFMIIRNTSHTQPASLDDNTTSQISPSTPAAEVEISWGTEETDNSGEAYAAHQQAIISGSSYDAAEKFDAILSMASYEITNENYAAAETWLRSVNVSTLSTEDAFRYYNVMTRLYDVSGDAAKRDEYTALATEYRNRLVSGS